MDNLKWTDYNAKCIKLQNFLLLTNKYKTIQDFLKDKFKEYIYVYKNYNNRTIEGTERKMFLHLTCRSPLW